MAKIKKMAALFAALLVCGSMFVGVACNKGGNNTDNSSSSSSEDVPTEPTIFKLEEHTWTAWETVTPKTCTSDGEEKLVCTDEGCGAVKTRVVKASHNWGDWTGNTDNLCTADATLSRTCIDCQETEKQTIAMRGHAYANGVCSVCNEPFVFPTLSASPTYVDVWGDSVYGNGTAYNRKALKADTYYTIDVPATDPESEDGGVWISVPIREPGQYALLTVGGANGVTIENFDASDFYIPGDENGYLGTSALQHENGNLYSIYNCSKLYFSESSRATWRFSTDTAATVKFVVVKVAPPIWLPEYIREKVYATQINNVKAADQPTGYVPAPVDYNGDYYYDEWNGVYRLGTKENPGEVIYLAVTATAPRLFGEQSFISIQEENDNLTLPYGRDELGNYLLREYHEFLLSDTEGNGNAYQSYVNADGMYPVTQELYEFLQLYTQKNFPVDIPTSIATNETEYAKKAWLAPCYCYRQLTPGTEEYPYAITELGNFEASPANFGFVYFKIQYTDESGAPITKFTLSCNDANAVVTIQGKSYTGPFSLDIDVETMGRTFRVGTANYKAATLTFNLSLADTNA